uniref:CHAT domain-containing protein n=1 Tax=Piscicoccus intestinalis TaxID=746033 RepID=UPI0012EDD2D8
QRAVELGRDGPAHARAQGWLAEAMLRRSTGRRRQAYLALSAGLQVLAQHRASVGSSELRARVGLNRETLAGLGLTMALEDADPATVHLWAEHARATAGLARPGRPPDDDRLADLLDRLRTTTARLETPDIVAAQGVSCAGSNAGPAVDVRAETERQAGLERDIREHVRRTLGDRAPVRPPIGMRALQAELSAAGSAHPAVAAESRAPALVEYVDHEGRLYAVTARAGVARLHDLGPVDVVVSALRYTSFGLARLARRGPDRRSHDAALAVIRRSGAQLEERLLAPLHDAIGDGDLVIVAPALLHALPWAVVPACRGRAVCVNSSASLWAMVARRRPRPGGVLVVAGPGLPEAQAEAREIDALYADAVGGPRGAVDPTGPARDDRRLLLPPDSTAAAVADALPGARVAHFAAHGDLRGNPSFSAVWLADGPFMVHDIERLPRTPQHVVLAACDTARSHVLAGREVLGLTTALLGLDTVSIVAPTVTIPDAQTRPLMLGYHRRLLAGLAPAAALSAAQAEVFAGSDDPAAVAAAAAFVCLGAGHTPVFGPQGPDGPHKEG